MHDFSSILNALISFATGYFVFRLKSDKNSHDFLKDDLNRADRELDQKSKEIERLNNKIKRLNDEIDKLKRGEQ